MRITRRSTFVGILAAIFGGSKAGAGPIRINGEEGFVDLDFPLTSAQRQTALAHRVVAQGTYEGKLLGFAAEIHSDWVEKPLEDHGVTFYWGRVTLRSIGEPSDSFVALLSRLYGSTSKAGPMLPEITAQAVGLGDDPRKLPDSPARMKLFFHSESEARYAEVFLNVDISGRIVQFHEKDEDYRENVVRALCERA
ncbi:MAG TPA: hypothetical protein VJT80_12685 [Steroidobacteraceae bacterium]|nr:hypothetical protein [Steroidobacteraceae bacterium]